VYRSKRKQLKESKQIRSMTRQRKYEMHAAICYKLPVHYRKGIADPKSYEPASVNKDRQICRGIFPTRCKSHAPYKDCLL
jgi:hypothetical protein